MKKLVYIAIGALVMSSCGLDDNIDPNNPQMVDLSPRELLAAAETRGYDVETTDIFELSNIWMNAWTGNHYQFASIWTQEYELSLTSSFRNGIWNNNYSAMANYANIINSPKAADYPFHVAIAKILLANNMQYIVDFYGDAPYSEAFQGFNNVTPRYDKGEDIYKALVLQLNDAIMTLTTVNVSSSSAVISNAVKASEDPIMKGIATNADRTKWLKLANTIKLRLLLRQSKVTDPNIKSFVDAQLATLSTASFVDSNVTINPGYSNANAAQQNPLYREYGALNYAGTAYNLYGWQTILLSDHLAQLMNGQDSHTQGTTDPRRTRLYSDISGVVQGASKDVNLSEDDFGMLEGFFGYPTVTPANGSKMDGYIMTKTEADLLRAEAAVLYPSLFSNAQTHYSNAVMASFTLHGATAAQATSYLSSLASKPYGWNTNQLAAIQYQRFIGLQFVKPQETYINFLKSDQQYPATPLALTAVKPNKPWRLIYPSREYQTNGPNTPNITAVDCFTKNSTTPFWNR